MALPREQELPLEQVFLRAVLDIESILNLEACARFDDGVIVSALLAAGLARHGILIPEERLAAKSQIRHLEDHPTVATKEFKEAEVLSGAPIIPVFVGSRPDLKGFGQLPPRGGDAWRLRFRLRKGRYWLRVQAGTNPYHGQMRYDLNGATVDSVDTYRTENNILEFWHRVEVPHTGVHDLCGTVTGKCAESRSFWQVLKVVAFTPWREEDAGSGEARRVFDLDDPVLSTQPMPSKDDYSPRRRRASRRRYETLEHSSPRVSVPDY